MIANIYATNISTYKFIIQILLDKQVDKDQHNDGGRLLYFEGIE